VAIVFCAREFPLRGLQLAAPQIEGGLGAESECRHGGYSASSACRASVKLYCVSAD
jgi:hypothetical protein